MEEEALIGIGAENTAESAAGQKAIELAKENFLPQGMSVDKIDFSSLLPVLKALGIGVLVYGGIKWFLHWREGYVNKHK